MPRRGALLLAVLLLPGCASLAPDDVRVRSNEVARSLPADVERALALEPGADEQLVGFEDVRVVRRSGLRVPEPDPVALGTAVAGCRAVVAALSPTAYRVVGRLPDEQRGAEVREGTDALCRRGLTDLVLTRDLVDTGLLVSTSSGLTLDAYGDRDQTGSTLVLARTPVPDVVPVPLPTTVPTGAFRALRLVVPAGRQVRAVLRCTRGRTEVQPAGGGLGGETQLRVDVLADLDPSPRPGTRACQEGPQDVGLTPRLRYPDASGRVVDEVALTLQQQGEPEPSVGTLTLR